MKKKRTTTAPPASALGHDRSISEQVSYREHDSLGMSNVFGVSVLPFHSLLLDVDEHVKGDEKTPMSAQVRRQR